MLRDRAMLVQVGGLALLAALCSPEAGRTQGTPAPAPAVATPIGKVVTAKGAITIEHVDAMIVQANLPANAEQPKAGDLVYKGDIVATGADSAIGITFADGTAFNLSSNARMVLNEFVYDPNGKSNSTLFSLSKGTFTFIAGKIARTGDMKIDTPVATMGIRGTTPHVEISSDGSVTFNTLIEDKKAIDKILADTPAPQKKPQRRTAANPGPTAPPSSLAVQVERKPTGQVDSYNPINIRICNC
jgi:hypothetical protein